MEVAIYLLIAVLGIGVGWLLASQRSKTDLARAQAQLEAQQTAMAASKEQFEAVAGRVVQQSTQQLLTLAEQQLKVSQAQSEKAVEERKLAVEAMVTPIRETLDKMQKASVEMEKTREGAYQALRQSVTELHTETQSLRDHSRQLSTALRGSSKARGNWGQVTLKNVVEAAGMTEHCDFEMEATLKSGEGGKRPDFLAHLPGGGAIPVDAKVPLASYWDGLELDQAEMRQIKMKEHAKIVRGHVDELARRDYSGLIDGGSDFTVLFIPADPILAAAFEADSDLMEYAMNKRVLISTPVTLLALLRTVAIYWQQQSLADNAKKIFEDAKEFYNRTAKFGEDFSKIGKGLNSALNAYNTAVGSFERRVMPAGRKLEQLKVTEAAPRQLKTPTPVEATVRPMDHLLPPADETVQ